MNIKRLLLKTKCLFGRHSRTYWTVAVGGRNVRKCGICGKIIDKRKVTFGEARKGK